MIQKLISFNNINEMSHFRMAALIECNRSNIQRSFCNNYSTKNVRHFYRKYEQR